MINVLRNFTTETLFDATSALLSKLNIRFDRETAEPISVADLYDGPMPQYLIDALQCIDKTYFIGIVNDQSLAGEKSDESSAETLRNADKYTGMFVFACDAKADANLTRTAASALTRAFNRISFANPVILVVRQNSQLSIATCERMNYSQTWRQGSGEKLGKVNILRNINCSSPHRGHIDILESLGEKSFTTFEELYKHWLSVFSSELLTKKFYNELSDWYAWAVQVVKFPNDLRTTEDDAKFNHESCIRLITRLIFVWFLKQKKLIPDEFFDENYIRENFIDEFDPHNRKTLLYDAEQSKYYRLILQNLFFAMLNCPIVAEGKDTPNNRRFRKKVTGYRLNADYNVNNLMRYEGDFMEGGAKKFVKLANSNVPFLNGGLFDCLDDKPRMLYYDGFSERKNSLEQLYFPDYLFFGDEVGKGIDLSQWYDDKKKKCVSARGIIDILNRYCFTIEENTPLDQEVSLDPELLGKVFENLLASYNPETKTSARKQTGSFYTPREIVQYMVDESLVAHLKRMCGDELEQKYRDLINYATDEVELTEEQRRSIMNAMYNCRVLDPACGSGAFPMGVLQQMVHVLKRVDPTNEMWNSMMIDIAVEDAKRELKKAAGNEQERQKIEENRKARLDDIENAFNQSINDPDYARKLYLIEHCIYGVDIQPIATQISKLRFFISLVVDQKPTNDAKANFGIRPLPNLEAKFVTANTLIPLDRSRDLFTSSDEVRFYEEQLHELNHRIFLAKRNKDKEALRQQMNDTRAMMAQVMENEGFIGNDGFNQLTSWNMFDQNASASFFDPEWMFGVKDGFDIVIANPPYVVVPKNNIYANHYKTKDCLELYAFFFEKAITSLATTGVISFITASLYIKGIKFKSLRNYLEDNTKLYTLNVVGDDVFENVQMPTAVLVATKEKCNWNFSDMIPGGNILDKMDNSGYSLNTISNIQRGFEIGKKQVQESGDYPFLTGSNVGKYCHTSLSYISHSTYLTFAKDDYYYTGERLMIRETGSTLTVLYEYDKLYCNRSLYSIKIKDNRFSSKFVLGCLNSKAIQYYYTAKFKSDTELFPKIRIKQAKMLPIPLATQEEQTRISYIVEEIIANINNGHTTNELESEIDHIVYHLYNLTYDEVLIIDPETPITREEYENYKPE